MKAFHIMAVGTAMAALPILAATGAGAQQRSSPPPTFHSPSVNGASRSASPFGARITLPPTLFPSGSFGSGPLGSVPPSAVGQFDGRRRDGRHHHRRNFHGGHFPGFILVERPFDYAQDERVVVREVVVPLRQAQDDRVPKEPAPPPPPRKPYVVGNSYASLPGGCMKMIEGGASYYYCGGGEWYRLVGAGRYKAIAKP